MNFCIYLDRVWYNGGFPPLRGLRVQAVHLLGRLDQVSAHQHESFTARSVIIARESN